MKRNIHNEAERERRAMRGANTLGWLVGPAIVVAIVVVASGCSFQDAPAKQPAGAATSAAPG